MHEHGLADQLLDALQQHRTRAGGGRITAATVEVCELGGATQEALQAALDHVCEHHSLAPIELTVEVAGLLGHCAQCGRVVHVTDDVTCGVCGQKDLRLCGSETVILKSCVCV